MPTYEYACAACGHEFEAVQSMKDAPLTKCPSCGADQAKRQISKGTGFILKGGGWYSDLYASSSNKSSGSASGSEGGTSTSTSSTSTSSEGGAKGSAATSAGASSGGSTSGGSTSGGSTS